MEKLFIFNPDCELAIANGSKYYMPPANIVQMAEDLAFLPAWLGEAGDQVLTPYLPDETFIEEVCRPLQLSCKAVTEKELENPSDRQGEPWGKSPKMCHWLALRGMGTEWQPEQKAGYSRKAAREALLHLMKQLPFVELGVVPQVCNSVEEIICQVKQEESWLVKAPWSSSGKGILLLEGKVGEKEREWLNGKLRQQGYLMLEKKLEKVKDFAMEFRAGEEGVEFIGWSMFSTGTRGEYRGNYIGPQENIVSLLTDYLGREQVELLKQTLPSVLTELFPFYRGYFGVDMLLYKDRQGKIRLQPCLEINLRYNMGIIALFLSRRYLAKGVVGEYTVSFYSRSGEAHQEHLRRKQAFPVVYKNNRIQSGYFNLTPVTSATHFVAAIRCY